MPEAALTEPSPRPVRIARGGWLDALRFIVGALIILYHFREAAPVPLGQLHPVFERGYLLTDFFIIDSGYVLARIYGDRLASGQASLRAYARQRLLRVIPAHLAVSLVLVLLVGGAALAGIAPSNPRWFDWSQLPAQVLLLQAWGVPGGQGVERPDLDALGPDCLLPPAALDLPGPVALAADRCRDRRGPPRRRRRCRGLALARGSDLPPADAPRHSPRHAALPARSRGGLLRFAGLCRAAPGQGDRPRRRLRARGAAGLRRLQPGVARPDDRDHLGRRRRAGAQSFTADRASGPNVVLDVPHE